MAVLGDPERFQVWASVMRDESTPFGIMTKADLRAAVDALDLFFENNAAAINSAIPQPARGVLTTAQKSRIVRYVIERRYG